MGNAKLKDEMEGDNAFADELEPGAELMHGQYKIESFLNAGGFGITYSARDSLDRRVVIKECFPGAFCRRSTALVTARSRAHQNELASIVRLFVQEARSLSKLTHPNIVGVHQVFEENNTAYMALDFIEGRDLLQIIEEDEEKLSPERVESILRKVLDAVGFVHDQNVLHRDISPDNILLNAAGEPVLIDFGAAREEATKQSRVLSALRVVKDGYSPQEFYITGSEQGPYSDLYALGATFYHLITGDLPPNSQARLSSVASGEQDSYERLEGRFAEYSPNLLKSIDKALAILPKDRIGSASDWLDIMDGKFVEPVAPVAANQTTKAAPAEKKKSGKGLLLASVAVIGLIAAGVVTQTDLLNGTSADADGTTSENVAAADIAAGPDAGTAVDDAIATDNAVATEDAIAPEETAAVSPEPNNPLPAIDPVPELQTAPAEAEVIQAPVSVPEVPSLETAVVPSTESNDVVTDVVAAPVPETTAAAPVIATEPADVVATESAPTEVAIAVPTFDAEPAPAITAERWPTANVWSRQAVVPTVDISEDMKVLFTAAYLPSADALLKQIDKENFVPLVPVPSAVMMMPSDLELLPELPQPTDVATTVPVLSAAQFAFDTVGNVNWPLQSAVSADNQSVAALAQPNADTSVAYDANVPPAPEPEPEPEPESKPVFFLKPKPALTTEWSVVLPYPDLFDPVDGEVRILQVNNVIVNSLEEFQNAVRVTVKDEKQPSVTLSVLMGGENGETKKQNWFLPVVQKGALGNGMSFETIFEGGSWVTRIVDVPEANEGQFQTGDILFGYIKTAERLDQRDSLYSILEREIEAGTTQYSFAVKRGDATWVVNFEFDPKQYAQSN